MLPFITPEIQPYQDDKCTRFGWLCVEFEWYSTYMFEERAYQYKRMADAVRYLMDNAVAHPSLESLAEALHVSEHHMQRTFRDWVGISPKQFLQTLHRQRAKEYLRTNTIGESAMSLGYSSESRLYDNFVKFESMTPGEYRKQGKGVNIRYGIVASPFGACLIAWTRMGVCKLSFVDEGREFCINELKQEWPLSNFEKDECGAKQYVEQIFTTSNGDKKPSLRLMVKGTEFQVKVWEALLALPEGRVATYQDVATFMQRPSSVRAVASAIAKNPIAYLIPCHRVIRSTGAINQYRWGANRKATMLLVEAASAVS